MSYILDALNKADKDRLQNASDLPETQHPKTSHPTPLKQKKSWLLWFIIMLVVWGLWFALSPKETIVPEPRKAIQRQYITPIIQPKPVVVKVIKTATSVPISKIEDIAPNIMGLDTSVRDQLPPIQISAHLFAKSASRRMVIINNRVIHEGGYIAEQLRLITITHDGITCTFQGNPFTMTTKDTWPPY